MGPVSRSYSRRCCGLRARPHSLPYCGGHRPFLRVRQCGENTAGFCCEISPPLSADRLYSMLEPCFWKRYHCYRGGPRREL